MLSKLLEYFQVLERVDFVWEMHADDWEWLEQNTPLNPDPFTIDSFVWETGPDTIRQLLPKLHSQGLLHFSTTGPEDPPCVVFLYSSNLGHINDLLRDQVVGILTHSANLGIISFRVLDTRYSRSRSWRLVLIDSKGLHRR